MAEPACPCSAGLDIPSSGAGAGSKLYAPVNNAATDPTNRFNQKEASEAVTGLGLALTSYSADDSTVTIGGNVLAWAKDALTVLCDNLRKQQWSSCPCSEDCGQHETDAAVLRALGEDLLLLS
jgi:hypothetical protein